MTEPPPTPPTPPGWPPDVAPPGTEGWERTAARWLWQWVPAAYRTHHLLDEQPLLLAHLAQHTLEAQVHAARAGYRTARVELRDLLEPHQIEQALALYTQEGRRLVALGRQVALVADALRGVRWRPGRSLR